MSCEVHKPASLIQCPDNGETKAVEVSVGRPEDLGGKPGHDIQSVLRHDFSLVAFEFKEGVSSCDDHGGEPRGWCCAGFVSDDFFDDELCLERRGKRDPSDRKFRDKVLGVVLCCGEVVPFKVSAVVVGIPGGEAAVGIGEVRVVQFTTVVIHWFVSEKVDVGKSGGDHPGGAEEQDIGGVPGVVGVFEEVFDLFSWVASVCRGDGAVVDVLDVDDSGGDSFGVLMVLEAGKHGGVVRGGQDEQVVGVILSLLGWYGKCSGVLLW